MYKITLDGSYLYHPWIRGRCITEGALTQEVNKNGSCDVSIVLDHPLAASVLRRKSMLEVIRFDLTGSEKTIYRGVVMNTVEDRDLEMEIQTEGDLVFFSGQHHPSIPQDRHGCTGKDNARKLFQVAG